MVERVGLLYVNKIGELDGGTYYDFPFVYKLAESSILEDLVKEKFGFRAKYVYNSAKYIVANGGDAWFKNLQVLPYEEAKVELMKLPGVAHKVTYININKQFMFWISQLHICFILIVKVIKYITIYPI